MENNINNIKLFNSFIYSSGFITLLINKLIEIYEETECDLVDLKCLDIRKISILPYTQKNILFINKLEKMPQNLLKKDLNPMLYYDVCLLPPTKYRSLFKEYNGITDEELNKYPYIQEFIDYLYEKRKNLNDDVIFVSKLRTFLYDYLIIHKKEEVLKYHKENNNELLRCDIDRDTFYNAVLYVVNRLETNSKASTNLDVIYNNETEDDTSFKLFYTLIIQNEYATIKNGSLVGTFYDADVNFSLYYKAQDVDIQKIIIGMVAHYSEINKDLKYLTLFFKNILNESFKTDKITQEKVEEILSEIKRVRTRKNK